MTPNSEQTKRTLRAQAALAAGTVTVVPTTDHTWRVQNGDGVRYTIHQIANVWHCNCDDFTHTCRKHQLRCKHIETVRLWQTLFQSPQSLLNSHEAHMTNTLNIFMDWKTLTGLTWQAAITAMKAVLPPAAYKAVPGAQGLTDIDPSYLTEKATDLFGPVGIGWWYDYEARDLELAAQAKTSQKGREFTEYEVNLIRFVLRVRYVDEAGHIQTSEPILSTGGNTNEVRSYAVRGALTNAIGAAFAKLCWQLPVYKGLVDHTNAHKLQATTTAGATTVNGPAKSSNGAAEPKAADKPAPTPKTGPLDPLAPVKAIICPVGTKAHPEFKGQTLGDLLTSEKGKELVLYLASEQWQPASPDQQAAKDAAQQLLTHSFQVT